MATIVNRVICVLVVCVVTLAGCSRYGEDPGAMRSVDKQKQLRDRVAATQVDR